MEFKNYNDEVKIMNRFFKGTAQDYLRLRAKKHRKVYGNEEGAKVLEDLASHLDAVSEALKISNMTVRCYKQRRNPSVNSYKKGE